MADTPSPSSTHRIAPRRIFWLLLCLALAAALALRPDVHAQVAAAFARSAAIMAEHPWAGAIVFVLASALGAMLVFFSTVLLVPLGIQTWGSVGCFLLLWAGWFAGGVLTYAVGRWLGRPAVDALLREGRLAELEARLPAGRGFWGALLLQLVFPSDVAGYFFGLLRYPPATYLAALALAELPFALGTVFLGTAFMDRAYVPLLVGTAIAAALLLWQWRARR